jgi:hypothetical protein
VHHAQKQIVLFTDGSPTFPIGFSGERKEDEMESRANTEREVCGHCGKRLSFIKCTGCEIPLCQECACFELIGSGCGTVIPAYYCLLCVKDARINPNAVFYS